jgi:polyferredoxin
MNDKIKNSFKKIKEEQDRIRKEAIEKTIGYILAAFGLVAGLAWNEAIKALIDTFFPLDKNGIIIKFVYAILVTGVVVAVTMIFVKREVKET